MSPQSRTVPEPDSPRRLSLRMSMAEIAELADVKRPVVTTWRRRYPSFPAPIHANALELLFDSRQVADWLMATGRDPDGRIEADLSLYALADLGTGLPANNLLAWVTALICLRNLDGEPLASAATDSEESLAARAARLDPRDMCLRSEIGSLPANAERLAAAVDELVEAAWGCREAFERILGARPEFRAGDTYARMVTPALARLIAELSGARERSRKRTITICDPAAGSGDLLTAVTDTIGSDYQAVFLAAEADPYLARLTARRLSAHGVSWADLKLATLGRMPAEWGDPDVVVTQIPYAPAESRSPEQVIDLLDDVALRLAPGRTAVVLGPADVLVGDLRPYSQAERTRVKLLSGGMVEAVIRLPGGLVPFRPGYEVALWVLTSAYNSPWRGWVLIADVSDEDLSSDIVEALVEDVVTWRRDGYRPYAHTRRFGVQVKIADLIDNPRSLTARRSAPVLNAGTAGAQRIDRIASLEAELDLLAEHDPAERRPIRSGAASRRGAPSPAQTIGMLAKDHRLIVKPGARLSSVQVGRAGHHDVIGVPELQGKIRRGDRRIDRITLAGQSRAHLTEPGDVIVTTVPEFRVLVDHDGLAVVEFPARVLRIPPAERQSFTPRTLAALLSGRLPSLRPAGAVRAARRLDEYEVPILSPAEVAFLDTLLANIDARQKAAQHELDVLDELRKVTTSGLLDGTLTFVGASANHIDR
jgi:hypothetical protein